MPKKFLAEGMVYNVILKGIGARGKSTPVGCQEDVVYLFFAKAMSEPAASVQDDLSGPPPRFAIAPGSSMTSPTFMARQIQAASETCKFAHRWRDAQEKTWRN